MKPKYTPVGIVHEMIPIPERQHWIDVFVLDPCRKLWDEGIETFFSCQGGPSFRNEKGKIVILEAYAQILEIDAEKACKILNRLNPRIDIVPNRFHKDRVAIRFKPSPDALNIDIRFDTDN